MLFMVTMGLAQTRPVHKCFLPFPDLDVQRNIAPAHMAPGVVFLIAMIALTTRPSYRYRPCSQRFSPPTGL